jgi:hypothetical protein
MLTQNQVNYWLPLGIATRIFTKAWGLESFAGRSVINGVDMAFVGKYWDL